MSFKTKKPREIMQLEKQVSRINEVAASLSDTMSAAAADRNFRQALANTNVSWLEEMPRSEQQKFLFLIMVAAKAADRKKFSQHSACDDALVERVEAEIARRAAEAKAQREQKAADAKRETADTAS